MRALKTGGCCSLTVKRVDIVQREAAGDNLRLVVTDADPLQIDVQLLAADAELVQAGPVLFNALSLPHFARDLGEDLTALYGIEPEPIVHRYYHVLQSHAVVHVNSLRLAHELP